MSLTSLNNMIAIRKSTSDEWLDITKYIESFNIGDGDLSSEDSGRTLDGTMHNNVVTNKEYYDLVFKTLTWKQMSDVMSVVKGRNKIQVKYPSPFVPDKLTTNWFYCQDRTGSCKMIHKLINGKVEVMWTGLTFRIAQI